MADMISIVASKIITKLGSEVHREVAAACSSEFHLHNLTDTITRVKQVLLADEIGQQHDFEGLIERLKNAVYDADDLVDELTTLAEQKRLTMSPSDGRFTEEVRNFFSSDNPIANAVSVSNEIERIRKTLDDIVWDRQRFPLPRRQPVQPKREDCSFVLVKEVIGRDEDKRKVLDVLFDHQDGPRTPPIVILPIVGTSGLGKTTLAQLAYDDEDVKNHFELREWVCVGDKFNLKDIIRSLLGSATDGSSLEKIHDTFRTKVRGKKYLFVLDDVWEENPQQLSRLKSLLSVGAKGSRVLVTTRSMDTAHHSGTISPLELQPLSKEDSWQLFANEAFEAKGHSKQQKDPSLVQMGQEIANKCKNLPLVIKVIASLLRGKDETYWWYFKDNDLASIDDAAETILPLLKLSYSRLSPQLKQCFLYCSLFPKDFKINRVEICHLWMAQGFITSSSQDSKVNLEDADQCFKKLLNRSFFQDIYKNEWGEIQSFKMHDYLHDLARKVAGKEILCVDGELTNMIPAATRHVCVGQLSLTSNLPFYLHKEGNRLRTFFQSHVKFREALSGEVSDLVSSFRCIRVLDLHGLKIEQLPDSMEMLIHLRYLNLSSNDFEMLPRSFTTLHNLETLNLSSCEKLKELPRDLMKLVNLQSLDLNNCVELAYMPPRMDNLTCLQRLSTFVVGFGESNRTGCCSELQTVKDASGFKQRLSTFVAGFGESNRTGCCSELQTVNDASGFDELSRLKSLRGRLDIQIKRNGHKNCVASTRTKADCLLNKSSLIELNITMLRVESSLSDGGEDEEELLECLEPHCNIRSLCIKYYEGRKFPSWMMVNDLCLCLPKLVHIELSGCKRCRHLPILNQLPSLKSLTLWSLQNVEYIEQSTSSASASVTFFQSLESLVLGELENVKGWRKPTAIETTELGGYDEQHGAQPIAPPSFHLLSSLRIENCPKMTSMPLCPSLKNLDLCKFNKELRVMETGEWNSEGYLSNPPPPSSSSKTLPTASTPSPLRQLKVDNTEYLNHLPKPCLHSLTRLRICGSEKDSHFSWSFLQHLTGLEELEFTDCKALGQKEVEEETDEMSGRSLGRLRRLVFAWVENLRTLPKWIEYLTNLQELRIMFCNDLEELPEWISQLSSLQRLEIDSCKGLKALPRGIGDLTCLQYLSLQCCSGLVERCRMPNGEDWPKIMHVSVIALQGTEVVHGGELRMRAGG